MPRANRASHHGHKYVLPPHQSSNTQECGTIARVCLGQQHTPGSCHLRLQPAARHGSSSCSKNNRPRALAAAPCRCSYHASDNVPCASALRCALGLQCLLLCTCVICTCPCSHAIIPSGAAGWIGISLGALISQKQILAPSIVPVIGNTAFIAIMLLCIPNIGAPLPSGDPRAYCQLLRYFNSRSADAAPELHVLIVPALA